jgi:hypothetical protein
MLIHPTLFRTLSLVPAEEEEKSLLGKLLQPLTGKHTIRIPIFFLGRIRILSLVPAEEEEKTIAG